MDLYPQISLTTEARQFQIPKQRLRFMQEHGITGATLFEAANPQVREATMLYTSQTAIFISRYGYLPQARAYVSDAAGNKSSEELNTIASIESDPQVQQALEEANAVLEHHAITTGSAYEAALGEPYLIETQERKPTPKDFFTMYSIMVLGLQIFMGREKMKARVEKDKTDKKKRVIKNFSIEGSFSPKFLQMLAQMPVLELDESGKAISPLDVVGIVPDLKVQLKVGGLRDRIIKLKRDLNQGMALNEDMLDFIQYVNENNFNLGQETLLTPETLATLLRDYPEQSGTVNILDRRRKTDLLIAERERVRGNGSKNRKWHKWLTNHDDQRKVMLEELMRETFKGNVIDGVIFPKSSVGVVNYNPEQQYIYPDVFRPLEEDLTDIAALWSSIR